MKTVYRISIPDAQGRPQNLNVSIPQSKGLLDAIKAAQTSLSVTADPANTTKICNIDLEVE